MWLSKEFPTSFGASTINLEDGSIAPGGNGVRYLRDDALFKVINNGNKTLSDIGH